MAITKKIKIDDKEVPFRASATVPRLYRAKFRRDIFKDLVKLKQSVDKSIEENQKNDEVGEVSDEEVVDETKMQFDSFLDIDTLEMFENVAYIMARHADPDNVPDTCTSCAPSLSTVPPIICISSAIILFIFIKLSKLVVSTII